MFCVLVYCLLKASFPSIANLACLIFCMLGDAYLKLDFVEWLALLPSVWEVQGSSPAIIHKNRLKFSSIPTCCFWYGVLS